MKTYEYIKRLLDIPEYQAKVLVTLYVEDAGMEALTKTELAEKSDIPRSKVYEVIKDLVDRKLADVDGKLVYLNEPTFLSLVNLSMTEFKLTSENLDVLKQKRVDERIEVLNEQIRQLEKQKSMIVDIEQ